MKKSTENPFNLACQFSVKANNYFMPFRYITLTDRMVKLEYTEEFKGKIAASFLEKQSRPMLE